MRAAGAADPARRRRDGRTQAALRDRRRARPQLHGLHSRGRVAPRAARPAGGLPSQPRDRAALRARGDARLPAVRPPARAARSHASPGAGAATSAAASCSARASGSSSSRAPGRCSRRSRCSRPQHKVGLEAVLLTLVYALGAAVPMLLVAIGGQRASGRLRAHGLALRRAMGVVVALAALALVFDTEQSLQVALGGYTSALQTPHRGDRARRRHGSRSSRHAPSASPRPPATAAAPEFKDIAHWLNTPGDRPLTLAGLRGKVVLVDFWTYSCINCLRTLPHLQAWYAAYHSRRARDRRRPHTRVRLRARARERPPGDARPPRDVARRARQRLRDLERVLATSTGPPST